MPVPAADHGPCERCGAEAWRVHRPGLVAGTTRWLRAGGRWRPSVTVCGGCGEHGPSTGWYLSWDDHRAPALTLPVRVVTELLRTVARERTAVPAPWLVLASTAGGAAVGAGAAVVGRTGRPLVAAAVGSACGGVACWAVFAATALRQPSTWSELRVAALQQLAPRRAAELRTAQHDAVARSAAFAAYGLARWDGPRALAGHSSEGVPPRVTSLALGHGELGGRHAPWALVDTAEGRAADQHAEGLLADALWDDASSMHDVDVSGLGREEVLQHLAEVRRARAARPEPQWHDGTLLVDGRPVPARWAADGAHLVARAVVGGLSVAVRTFAVPLDEVDLVAVGDLDARPGRPGADER